MFCVGRMETCRMLYHLYTCVIYALIYLSIGAQARYLQGHLNKFGEQSPPSLTTPELGTVPQPEAFFKNYVLANKPVVFRGAAKHSRAFHFWTEEYLKGNYGNLTVRLEARYESNSRLPVGKIGLGLDALWNFIDNYQSLDGYIISQLPQPMEKDIMILPCLRCGSFAKSIQEVHLFLSAAGGKTALHKDPYSNIHCVFNGTKDWITVHPDQTEYLYMSPDSQYEWGGLSEIDVDRVDLEQHPDVAKLNYSKVRLNKGDCIFMPSGYWHQVRSWGYLNSAVSIWFSAFNKFDKTGCKKEGSYDFTPMNEVDILWRYSGFGNLTQGHMDIYVLQKALSLWADKQGVISLQSFASHFFTLLNYNAERKAMANDLKARKRKFIEYLDEEKKGFTTLEVINNLNTTQLKDLVELIHPNDISNTDVLEYGHIDGEEIRDAILKALGENGVFGKTDFRQNYVEELGGTPEKANQILEDLNLPLTGFTSRQHLLSNIGKALDKYTNAVTHDPATEKRLFQFLKTGKTTLGHDEL